jgi:hypothetical protein
MAKKQARQEENTEALATVGASALATAGDQTSRVGKEGFGQEDMTFPRIAFAQKTSPQIDPENDEYIESLKLYQMFNNLTGTVYGNEIAFAIIRRTKRAIEFDEQGNVVDFDVPLDDPRLAFTDDGKGGRGKPRATLFYEYLIAIPRDGADPEIGILSLKTTQIKNARKLNSLIALRPGAVYAGLWKGSTSGKSYGPYTATNFIAVPTGATPKDLFNYCEQMYAFTEGKRLETQRDVDGVVEDEKVPF